MTVIEASSGTYSSRVDGTIVLRVEIEPRHRAEALALFGMPGTPLALAALKVKSSKPEPRASSPPSLCAWAAIRGGDPSFIAWLEEAHPKLWAEQWADDGTADAEQAAAQCIRLICGVASRRELDTNDEAAALFHSQIREPYAAWMQKRRP